MRPVTEHPSASCPPIALNGPEYARVAEAMTRFGLSRTGIYRLAGRGHIRLVKLGGRTLVDLSSVRAYLASQPPAQITTGVSKAA